MGSYAQWQERLCMAEALEGKKEQVKSKKSSSRRGSDTAQMCGSTDPQNIINCKRLLHRSAKIFLNFGKYLRTWVGKAAKKEEF